MEKFRKKIVRLIFYEKRHIDFKLEKFVFVSRKEGRLVVKFKLHHGKIPMMRTFSPDFMEIK